MPQHVVNYRVGLNVTADTFDAGVEIGPAAVKLLLQMRLPAPERIRPFIHGLLSVCAATSTRRAADASPLHLMAEPKSLIDCTVQEVAAAVRARLGWSEALTQKALRHWSSKGKESCEWTRSFIRTALRLLGSRFPTFFKHVFKQSPLIVGGFCTDLPPP